MPLSLRANIFSKVIQFATQHIRPFYWGITFYLYPNKILSDMSPTLPIPFLTVLMKF